MVFTKEEIFNVLQSMNRFVISILFFFLLERHEVLACFENEVMYEGNCHDVFDTVCSESPGMRLYLGEDGLGYCDCMSGWIPFEGRCYQEFTPATPLCPDQQIIIFKNPKVPDFTFPEYIDSIERQLRLNYSCIESPCNSTSLPHSSTWNYTDDSGPCHPIPVASNFLLDNCELAVDYDLGLKCCDPSERLDCYFEQDFDPFLQTVTSTGVTKSCRGDCIFSPYVNKCVSLTRSNGCDNDSDEEKIEDEYLQDDYVLTSELNFENNTSTEIQ